MSEESVTLKAVEPMRVACIRDKVADYRSVGPIYEEVFAEVGSRGLAPTGPPLCLYYDEEYTETDVDVEVAVPVDTGEPADEGRFKIRDLPAHEQVASLVRKGPYDDFTPSYQTLMDWIEANGYRIVGPNREIYLQGPESELPPQEWLTEIQFPVAAAE